MSASRLYDLRVGLVIGRLMGFIGVFGALTQ